MLKKILFILFIAIGFSEASFSQTSSYKWWNPEQNPFPVIEGQGWHEGLQNFYDRLPAKAERTVRKSVWNLSHDAAGLMIRFRAKTTDIYIRYAVSGKLNFPHMSTTGVSGLDLFAVDKNGEWQWDGQWSGGFHFGDTILYHYSSLPNKYTKEYHLYLPLYNNVKWLEIGVPDSSIFTPLPVSPTKPIVVYGTSIAQGACASRPGMAWTAILGRRMHRPVINLGFSGNGRLESSVVDLLLELNPKIYIIDCLPNMTGFPADTVNARLTQTIKTLRKRKPDIPVIVVEDPHPPIGILDQRLLKGQVKVNKEAEKVFTKLKSSGMQGIYLLTADELGLDIESTVAGLHPNDYGMELYAAAYEKILREIWHEPSGKYSTTKPVKQYRSMAYDWNYRHERELKMNKSNPPKIIFLGNSITHYWGGEPEFSKIQRGEDSWQKYFTPHGVRNFGFSWDRIENVLWRVYHGELDGYKARQVLINIGTNNLAYNSDVEIMAGLKLLIEAVKERQPAAEILIIGIFPRKEGEERVANLNEQIVQLCGLENVNYTDPGVGLLDGAGKIIPSLFADGRLHPNAAGYRILGKALVPYLK